LSKGWSTFLSKNRQFSFEVKLQQGHEMQETRLGEFSPLGRLFSLGSFVNMTEVELAQILGKFSVEKAMCKFRQMINRATLWAFFHKLIWSP
jgi:hypothetical protein